MQWLNRTYDADSRRQHLLLRATGCMDTYCSPETLMEDGESLPGFFSVLEQGEQEHRERFSQWLDYMALAVTNIRSVLAGDVIISGEAAQYLDDDDMAGLRERVVEHTPFGTTDFTLRKGMALDHQDIIGAACVLWTVRTRTMRYVTAFTHILIALIASLA